MKMNFRAWDKINNMMCDVDMIDLFLGEIIEVNFDFDGPHSTMKFEDVEIMQSTGLKDINGKEIFEGDIVEHLDGEYSFVGSVKHSIFGLYVESEDDNYSFEDFADENTMTADCAVIGNIYMNQK